MRSRKLRRAPKVIARHSNRTGSGGRAIALFVSAQTISKVASETGSTDTEVASWIKSMAHAEVEFESSLREPEWARFRAAEDVEAATLKSERSLLVHLLCVLLKESGSLHARKERHSGESKLAAGCTDGDIAVWTQGLT